MSRLAGFAEWLATAAAAPPLAALHESWCRELLRRGLPVWRSTLGLETLHPEISGTQLIWTDGSCGRRSRYGRASRPVRTT